MLTLYGVSRSRASRNIWLLNELNVPFKQVPVIQAYRLKGEPPAGTIHTRSPDFLKINPNGHVPSMEDDGLILHESLAINLYIAKKHGGPLAPKDLKEDGLLGMWSLWAATEIEPHSIQIYYHMIAKPEAERDAKVLAAAIEALKAPFAVLDKALAEGNGHPMGGRFTVADINLAEVIRYAIPARELWTAAPHVDAWIKACHARPAFKAMMDRRNAEPE